MALHVLSAYLLGTSGGIAAFNNLKVGMLAQKSAALHKCNGVRVHFRDVVPVVFGKAEKAVLDVQLMLANNGSAAFAKQLVVVQQTACNGVFDGYDSYDIAVCLHVLEYFLEGVAAYQFNVFAFEVLMCRDVVERTDYSLYCNFLHISKIKNPACLSSGIL